jgi:small subunit ribosomal protein S6
MPKRRCTLLNKLDFKYEFFIIISTKLNDQETENIIEKFSKLIESVGSLENIEKWGKRKLAYQINHETDGFYVLFNFSSEASLPAELCRTCNITDGILRNLVVKKAKEKVISKQNKKGKAAVMA